MQTLQHENVVEVSTVPPKARKRPYIKRTTLKRMKISLRKIAGLNGQIKPKKKYKFKKSELKKADSIFSEKIRTRDGKCQFPGCEVSDFSSLQCSHYIGRATWSTRFDEENCVALCWHHHFKSKELGYEYQKQRIEKHGWDGQYTLFMKKWLGTEKFNALIERSLTKLSRRIAIENVINTTSLGINQT